MNDNKPKINENKKSSDARGRSPLVVTVFISIIVMLIVTASSFYFYVYTRDNLSEDINESGDVEYSQYYAFICDNDEFNRQIYQYAKEKGNEDGICVDMLSQRIDTDYSIEELFEIARQSNVDGIIVEAKDAQKMKSLIDEACNAGIDVVTLLSDSPDSLRRSSIQVGAYNLGKTYGQQIVSKKLRGEERILVIGDASKSDASQNLIFKGIQDYVLANAENSSELSLVNYPIDGTDTFEMEETIRSIFIDEETSPDIIICTDNQATEIVYQFLVDYNRVGEVRLIGYHDSQTILSGIRQGVIEATIAVDVKELGEYSVEALSEYKETGYASEYYSVDSTLIDIENVLKYETVEAE